MVASAATTHAVRDRAWTRPLVSATPFATGLAFHALLRPRDHLEPRDRDAITAGDAQSVQSRRDALQGAVDVADGLARRGRQGQITFAFDAHRVTFARLLVELGVALLALRRELLGRGLELLGLTRVALALLLEALAQLRQRARRKRRRELPRRFLLDRRRLGRRLRRGERLVRGLHRALRRHGRRFLYRRLGARSLLRRRALLGHRPLRLARDLAGGRPMRGGPLRDRLLGRPLLHADDGLSGR